MSPYTGFFLPLESLYVACLITKGKVHDFGKQDGGVEELPKILLYLYIYIQ